jgi:hypothetical protein
MRRYLAAVFLQLVLAAAAASQQSAGIAIHGHVDAEDTGEPARGAKVTLTEISVFNTRRRAGVSTTDENGSFTFAGLTPGYYTLYIEQPNFLAEYVNDAAPLGDIVIHLRRAAVVSGSVAGADGEIIGKALVEVMKKDYTYGELLLQSVVFTWTDNRGTCQVSGLAPGRYYVRASRDGYDTILYPDATGLAGAQTIDVMAGNEKDGIDFRLRRAPRFALEGRLLDSAARAPAQAKFLRAYSADLIAGTFIDGVVHKGRFRLDGLKPGRYFLEFDWVGPTNNVTRRAVFPFEMGNANESGVVLRAARVSVAGRVDAGGRKLPGQLNVYLEPTAVAARAHIGGSGANADVARDGTFRMPGVQIGEYHVRVHYSQAASFFVNEQSLIVDGRTPIKEIELKLDFSAGSVSGMAINAAGDVIPGATVVLQSAEPEKFADNLYLHVYGTSAAGWYSIPGVVLGEYLLFSWRGDRGAAGDPDLFTLARKNARRIRVNPGGAVSQDATELRDLQTNPGN